MLAGPEHGRTIPLADIGGAAPWICAHELADLNEREAGAPWETAARTPSDPEILRRLLQSCFITPIYLCDWREEALLIWMRSRGVIWVLPRATNDALSRRFAER